MPELSRELEMALDAEEAEPLNDLISRGRQEDYDALVALVEDPATSEAHRRKALYALGRWGSPQAVTAIVSALPEMNELERISAADALGRIADDTALDGVLALAADSAPDVRRYAVKALDRIGTERALSAIRSLVEAEEVEEVRSAAQKSLRSRGIDME